MIIDSNPILKYEGYEKWKYFLMPLLEYPIFFWVAIKKIIQWRETENKLLLD